MGSQKKVEAGTNLDTSTKHTETKEFITTTYNKSADSFKENVQNGVEVDSNHFSKEMYNRECGMYRRMAMENQAFFEDIALPAAFLEEYYSQVPWLFS